jgi:uncharacterized protein
MRHAAVPLTERARQVLGRVVDSLSPSAALRRAIRLTEREQMVRAFPLLARAARAGLAEAAYRVGRCYLEGAGVPPSRREGARWLERAAASGHVEAQARLAALHLQGLGAAESRGQPREPAAAALFAVTQAGEPDFVAAQAWARRAAEGGSADGQAMLAYILTSGPEPMRDLEAAHQWYERSAAAGCPQGVLGYGLSLARLARDEEDALNSFHRFDNGAVLTMIQGRD